MATTLIENSPNLGVLYAKAAVTALGRGGSLPGEHLARKGVTADPAHLAEYARVCRLPLNDVLPATYPHMLAFPLQLSLMTDPSFPFPAIGLVHIYNRITQHRPIKRSERLQITVWATPVEDHPRGRQFSLHSEALVGEELVWEEVSTNLKRGRGSDDATAPGAELPSAEDLPAIATWSLPGDLGRRYGSVSGDLNPIHMHPLTARLFGFKSAIAHGMWTKARCLAALEPRLPDTFTVEVTFKKPILLPGKVEFCEADSPGAAFNLQFGVRDPGKGSSHLDGLAFSG
jgi:acyl dehydratase